MSAACVTRQRLLAWLALVLLATALVQSRVIAADTETLPPPVPPIALAPEVLIFHSGDRLAGRLVRREGETLVFHSIHLGEIRVPTSSARVLPAEQVSLAVAAVPAAPAIASTPSAAAPPPPPAAEVAGVRKEPRTSWWISPAALSENVIGFLGPWKGRFAVALSLTDGNGRGENLGADLSFSRKWTNDEVRFETHYYFASTDEVVKTDLLKGTGIMRHDFRGPFFVSYRPTIEWNRNHFLNGQPADYVLGQHSIGLGINVVDLPGRKIGLGVAENVFDVWTLEDDKHSTRDAQSVFGEVELQFPWRVSFTGRATWYYTGSSGDSGWEDQFELTKKFSDTLSLGLRREARHANPDPRIADYSLLRLQLGLDF